MTGPQPQYAPGDPVLVAGEMVDSEVSPQGNVGERIATGRGSEVRTVRAADVHPVPPTPDPRDGAIAAARGLADHWEQSLRDYPGQLPGTDRLYRNHAANLRRCLDGVVPVPAPPAPTPTGGVTVTGRIGWRNSVDVRTGSQLDVYGPGGRWGGPVHQGHALIDALVEQGAGEGWQLTVTATPPGEAAAAAPATTDDDRVQVAAVALARHHSPGEPFPPVWAAHRAAARVVVAALDAHRAAGSPS